MSDAPARDSTDITTTVTGTLECKVYYQDTKEAIREHTHSYDSGWQPTTTPIFSAKPDSPLASVSFDSGNEVHVYCVSVAGYLEEHVYSSKNGDWSSGTLNKSRFRVAETSKLAAVSWPEDLGIRVYAQNPDDTIQEYQYEASTGWRNPVILPVAQVGSSLAALSWADNGQHLRVYYIAPDSTVKEHRYDPEEGWREGISVVGTIPPYASIAAVAWFDSSVHQRVYLQNSNDNIFEYEWDTANGEWSSKGHVIGPLRPGRHVAALEWKTGTELRVYYQDDDGKVREQAKSNEGPWYTGEFEG
ncbi:fucose-specific lectin [Xylaria digitata]|nr:fucose-specific lectin [Xylaria digitata]